MTGPSRHIALAGALLALSGVVLAAMGSHMVDMQGAGMQGMGDAQRIWQTASMIHLFNAAALVGLAAWLSKSNSSALRWGAWLIVAGTVVFAGSLYLRVFTAGDFTGYAPAGGLLMMAGWLSIIFSVAKNS